MPQIETFLSAQGESGWHGQLQLTYAREGKTTQIVHCQGQAPLKVQRPFYPEGTEVCHSVILHTAGGVVGGDRLSIDLDLQPQSHAVLTTAAANKLYRSNGLVARQTIHIHVAAGGILEWLPQETIVFDQAVYGQDLRVDLEPGATWAGWEITRFGRSARGEKFLQGNWRSHTQVWQYDRPLWIDQQWLPGHETVFHSPHGLAGCPVVGSFAWIGPEIDPDWVQAARGLGQSDGCQPADDQNIGSKGDRHQGAMGVTRLQQGLLCRYRGCSTIEARQWFTQVWHLMRSSCLGRSACRPRVWQI